MVTKKNVHISVQDYSACYKKKNREIYDERLTFFLGIQLHKKLFPQSAQNELGCSGQRTKKTNVLLEHQVRKESGGGR